jgi:hypothetical protein
MLVRVSGHWRLEYAHWVRDDQDVGLGGVVSGSLGQIADNGGVGVEQVWVVALAREIINNNCVCCTITGHAGLAGNTSGDDNNLSTLESVGKT